jgi:alpha-beta hydrolase superfamily lysophospholipase
MKLLKRIGWTSLCLFVLLNIIGAFHAYKFTHFYPDTSHANKRPEQMSTWEKTRMILFGIQISKPVVLEKPTVPYETITLHTSNNLKLEGWWIPTPQSRGTVILFHGYMGNKGSQLPEAAYFRELGFNTFLLDFRAHGNSDGMTTSVGYKEAEDVWLAYEFVRQQKAEKHIILWGTSMGAAAILKAVPEYKLVVDKIILESPFASLTDAVKGRMRAVHLPGTPLAQLLTFWGGIELGFSGFSFVPAQYAQQIQLPVLLCWGQQDTRVTEQETQAVYTNLASKDKTLLLFPNAGHESFCRQDPEKWKTGIQHFLTSY